MGQRRRGLHRPLEKTDPDLVQRKGKDQRDQLAGDNFADGDEQRVAEEVVRVRGGKKALKMLQPHKRGARQALKGIIIHKGDSDAPYWVGIEE